jgi:hypothetical protein
MAAFLALPLRRHVPNFFGRSLVSVDKGKALLLRYVDGRGNAVTPRAFHAPRHRTQPFTDMRLLSCAGEGSGRFSPFRND